MKNLIAVMQRLEEIESTLDDVAAILHVSVHELVNKLLTDDITMYEVKLISAYTETNVYDLFEI